MGPSSSALCEALLKFGGICGPKRSKDGGRERSRNFHHRRRRGYPTAVPELMRASGYSPVAYDFAENFLASDASGSSDCIITDIQMPGLTGIELKQRLEAGACATPVIMITARREERLLAQARASGAFCLLRKPFKASALIDCVRRHSPTRPAPTPQIGERHVRCDPRCKIDTSKVGRWHR